MKKLRKNEVFLLILLLLEIVIQTCTARYVRNSLMLELTAIVCFAVLNQLQIKICFRLNLRYYRNVRWYIVFLAYTFIIDLYIYTISSFDNQEVWTSIKHILGFEIVPLILLWIVLKQISSERIVIFIRNSFAFLSYVGVIEFLIKKPILGFLDSIIPWQSGSLYETYIHSILGYMDRVRIIFFHPIICAVYMLVGLIFLFFFPFRNVAFQYITYITYLISLIGTQSRSSWVSCIIVIIIYFIGKKEKLLRKKSVRRTFLGIGVLLLCFLIYLALGDLQQLREITENVINRWNTGLSANSASNYNRINMIRMGLNDFIHSNPLRMLFGHGGGYALDLLRQNPILGWSEAVDNQYLTILMDYGMIGLTLYLSMPIKCSIDFFRSNNRMMKCFFLSLISIFISTFFYEVLSWKYTMLLFIILYCLLENYSRQSKKLTR